MKKIHSQQGFTLIEIMVATSIFMIIMLIAMGALITTTNAAKKAQALRVAMDNVNFATESMTRSLRMGADYTCTNSQLFLGGAQNADCAGGGGGISFTPASVDTTPSAPRSAGYALIDRGNGTNTVKFYSGSTFNPADIVAENVDVEDLKFFVKGSLLTDGIQPSVYIIMKGSVLVKGEKTPFVVQTMTSQRNSE